MSSPPQPVGVRCAHGGTTIWVDIPAYLCREYHAEVRVCRYMNAQSGLDFDRRESKIAPDTA
jgi:hypothetical protein